MKEAARADNWAPRSGINTSQTSKSSYRFHAVLELKSAPAQESHRCPRNRCWGISQVRGMVGCDVIELGWWGNSAHGMSRYEDMYGINGM
jgi:hypothetical protein